jgi:hypothetical protein
MIHNEHLRGVCSLRTAFFIGSTCSLLSLMACGSSFASDATGGTGHGTGGAPGTGGVIGGGGVISSGGDVGVAGGISIGGAIGACESNITLRMVPSSSGTNPTQYCDACSAWLSISPVGGSPVALGFPCGAVDCNTCSATPCPAVPACIPQLLSTDGLALTWNGTVFTDVADCGASCVASECMPPGRYVAQMCATKAESVTPDSCTPSSTLVCAPPVEFTLPGDGEFEAQLP